MISAPAGRMNGPMDCPSASKLEMKGNPILLVEDSANDVDLLRLSFRKWRLTNPLHVANSGANAIDYLSGYGIYADRRRHPLPSLVLLDLDLPGITGFEVLEWLRSQPQFQKLAVVVLTGSEDGDDIEKAYRFGADSFLVKLHDEEKLRTMIDEINQQVLVPRYPEGILQFAT